MPNPLSNGIAVALIVGASVIASAVIVSRSLVRVKTTEETIHVIGSARKPIRSDFIIWTGTIAETAATSGAAYAKLQADTGKLRAYLAAKGIPAAEIVPNAVDETTLYARVKGEANAPMAEDDAGKVYRPVVGYQLSQDIEVRSASVDRVDAISRQSTELISQGIPFESQKPMYLYTKLSDLKVEMQAEAAQDARARAEQIARSSGVALGPLRSANMNTPVITPLYSSEQTDNGVDDTTALDKKITTIVSANYAIR